MTSYYAVLGVSRNATKAAIRAAYLQKAKRYHPDINQSPQALELFKAVQEAYQVLADDVKRQDFDEKEMSSQYEPRNSDSFRSSTTAYHGKENISKNNNTFRFRGRVFDPEAEREKFNQDFYTQAEALRREMEAEGVEIAAARQAIWKFYQGFGRFAIQYVVVPTSVVFLVIRLYRRLTNGPINTELPILLDMYGRAYSTDRFGRRIRAPKYDDRKRVKQWESSKASSLSQFDENCNSGWHTIQNHGYDVPKNISKIQDSSYNSKPGAENESTPIRASSQHIRASSQHIRASSQHIRASSQHIRASSQHIRAMPSTPYCGPTTMFSGCVDSIPPTAHRFVDVTS